MGRKKLNSAFNRLIAAIHTVTLYCVMEYWLIAFTQCNVVST